MVDDRLPEDPHEPDAARAATICLGGDVMTGRGIDHILAHPSDSRLFEPYVKDASEYVALAEAANGPVRFPVRDGYIWGDALVELAHRQPRVRVVNLETSVTRSADPWPDKGIHYRMHPDNISCLTAARLDVCVLANNHVLDFGRDGLAETLDVLHAQGIRTAGAGRDLDAARAPAIVRLLPGSRLLVFGVGTTASGIPDAWGAGRGRSGVELLPDLSERTAGDLGRRIRQVKQRQDTAIVSIHWGDNWGYDVPQAHRRFAHWLVDEGADLIHGHSSHHPRPIEVYRDRLILYGCGDLLNDYEGIGGYEQYRGDLALLYFATLVADSGRLTALEMVPLQIRNLKLVKPALADARWLWHALAQASAPFGAHLEFDDDGLLRLGDAGRSGTGTRAGGP